MNQKFAHIFKILCICFSLSNVSIILHSRRNFKFHHIHLLRTVDWRGWNIVEDALGLTLFLVLVNASLSISKDVLVIVYHASMKVVAVNKDEYSYNVCIGDTFSPMILLKDSFMSMLSKGSLTSLQQYGEKRACHISKQHR